MSTIMDIFKRISERRGWDVDEDVDDEIALEKEREKRVWNEVIKQIHDPFEALSAAIDQGLLHAAYCLEVLPQPKPKAKKAADVDVEAQGQNIQPGQPGFSAVLDKKVAEFARQKGYDVMLDISKLDPAILFYDEPKVDVTKAFIVFYNARTPK